MSLLQKITLAGALAALLALSACQVDTSSLCVIPPCGTPSVGVALSLTGFPAARVDRTTVYTGGYHGLLKVGDVVVVYLVRSLGPGSVPADTIRAGLTWALRDSVAMTIETDASGAGILTARARGFVPYVIVNATAYDLISCGGPYGGCDRLAGVDVVP